MSYNQSADENDRFVDREATENWDILVYCENMRIKCSSRVLKSQSDYFKELISSMNSLEEGIVLHEVSVK